MNRFRILFFAVVSAATFACGAVNITEDDLSDALGALDGSLMRSEAYIASRQRYIDSLVATAGSDVRPDIMLDIADACTSFNSDSARTFVDRGIAMTSGAEQLPFRWRRAVLMPLVGFIESAEEEFDRIPADSIPPEQMLSYLEAGRQMHSYIASFFHAYPELYARHMDSARSYQLQMLELLPRRSIEYRYNQAEYYFTSGRRELAKVIFEDLLDRFPRESNLRARASHHLSAIALEENDTIACLYYLALSARADVEAATREMLSLQELGMRLSDNQVDRAYSYMYAALRNAVDCGATLRTVDISQALPVIERAHSENQLRHRHTIYGVIIGLSILMIGLVVTLIVLRYEVIKMRRLQLSLLQANRAKEIYISQFLQLCSIYMDKLNQFSKIVTRKLAAGQSDELYRMTKSGRFVEEQSREFYDVFDNAFLHIYPDFVADVNRLLREDAQIVLKDGELLNTDLRICAFIRLGIEESARIAQVLNYSLNTIYAYRNRLKSRAISRDTFEEDIAKIESME